MLKSSSELAETAKSQVAIVKSGENRQIWGTKIWDSLKTQNSIFSYCVNDFLIIFQSSKLLESGIMKHLSFICIIKGFLIRRRRASQIKLLISLLAVFHISTWKFGTVRGVFHPFLLRPGEKSVDRFYRVINGYAHKLGKFNDGLKKEKDQVRVRDKMDTHLVLSKLILNVFHLVMLFTSIRVLGSV